MLWINFILGLLIDFYYFFIISFFVYLFICLFVYFVSLHHENRDEKLNMDMPPWGQGPKMVRKGRRKRKEN